MEKLIKQIIRFGTAGVLCFVIDYLIMIVLTDYVNVYYLYSSGISFSVSTVLNYILSITCIFEVEKKASKSIRSFLQFILLSMVGLLINQTMMGLLSGGLGVYYKVSKIAATAVVMVYNFISRKLLLEKRHRTA